MVYKTQYELHEIQTADGEIFALNDQVGKWVMSFSGYGMAVPQYVTQRGYQQNGVTVTEQFLTERTITLTYEQNTCSRNSWWNARQTLNNILRINRGGDFWLRRWTVDGQLRQIKARYGSGATYSPRNPSGGLGFTNILEELTFLCADPLWYGEEITLNAGSGTRNNLIFPAVFPIWFESLGNINSIFDIVYNGDWESYPSVTLVGPITGLRIANLSIGSEAFILFYFSIPVGVTATIQLSPQGPFVTSSDGIDRNGYIRRSGTPSDVKILPYPLVTNGENQIQLIAGDATPVSSATLTYSERFEGI